MEAEVASETEEGEDRRLRRKDDGTDARDGRRRVKDMQIDTDDPQAIARAAALAERQQFELAVQELRQALETKPELEDFKQSLGVDQTRSEEHTSELQSIMRTSYAAFCLKKKKK